ncbi:leukocyte elastase inhibitor isoform X2 [Acyrthosiphon pisum]|uniref:Serpin domain-containing protein n=1 Tax=Acyrthosiphon pisum TaxID=7029 RepID=A0A8R2F8W5_ACYPI|nr:leukocyte elastase inhibitor isoform X2 [Acyrthosiphon pisum]|eukprot:XP_008183051.1 PREDICTED: leukocyte elastase inhibitor isoform X2 [Acyrthosiphon pisum]
MEDTSSSDELDDKVFKSINEINYLSDNKMKPLTTNLEILRSANHNFSFSVYKEVAKTETGNIFYSPFGIHLIMFMASTGAASKTFDEMVATLHLNETSYSMEAYRQLLEDLTSANYNLKLATGMFVDTDFDVKDSFVENSKKYLKSSMEKLDFRNDPERQRRYLNNWVLIQTNNKIKDFFSCKDSITKDTALVLVNAVHFKSDWAHTFKHVYDDFFYVTPSNKVTVKMMTLTRDFQYLHDTVLKFKALELPYKHHGFKMTILLPDDKNGLKNLENNFSKFKIHEISEKMTQNYVKVKLPRFKIIQSLELDKTLSNLGCPTMFTPGAANFSNIVEDGKLYVTKISHKAYVDVNEDGTEAAAVTSLRCGSRPSKDFIVDHPFIFFISTMCNFILFVGRMTKID